MEERQTRLEEVLALARRLSVLDKVRLLEEVVADLEISLGAIANPSQNEARPE